MSWTISGRTVGTDFRALQCCTGSRQEHRSTGGLRPLQPLQSGSFQFQSHETHTAAGMRGSSDDSASTT